MDEKNEQKDKQKSKSILKKAVKICVASFLALGVLAAALYGITELLRETPVNTLSAVSGIYFFPADYEKNIFEDEYYLVKDRRIMYSAYGETREAKSDNPEDISVGAAFFYKYFTIVMNGDYTEYKKLFTDECLEKVPVPERFTMQMVYDINVSLFKRENTETESGTVLSEIYEVRYRIFENNGTLRGDIPSGETRTLVFELYIADTTAKINAIGYRTNAD